MAAPHPRYARAIGEELSGGGLAIPLLDLTLSVQCDVALTSDLRYTHKSMYY